MFSVSNIRHLLPPYFELLGPNSVGQQKQDSDFYRNDVYTLSVIRTVKSNCLFIMSYY